MFNIANVSFLESIEHILGISVVAKTYSSVASSPFFLESTNSALPPFGKRFNSKGNWTPIRPSPLLAAAKRFTKHYFYFHKGRRLYAVSYTHLDVYKRQVKIKLLIKPVRDLVCEDQAVNQSEGILRTINKIISQKRFRKWFKCSRNYNVAT